MTKKNVLLVGESWTTNESHTKGFDLFATATFKTGATDFLQQLEDSNYQITYMTNHEAQEGFPTELEELNIYDIVVLSDIGTNTLLLHPDTWAKSARTPNRLKLIKEYVLGGGALMMIGGYLSFQGINGAARYHGTPVEDVLPVTCLPRDDRVEVPEGFVAELVADHPVLSGVKDEEWPYLLGYNQVEAKEGATVLAVVPESQHPLLACQEFGRGRALVWTSDMAVHWVPEPFIAWSGYKRIWTNCFDWLTEIPATA
ncbi:glutamine amidotransferase [Vibrio nigripulchritudo]|uniref:glutamine amidotransferase n=1 Tax=Vibrio nigripulchritudo TaxID=28173 RepID=UPI0003B1829C|nr:glutamine amidotransferase [Vibrio nigripulchritudo]CCN73208.1 conserved hypothetical protein [Vibrio nigripulchritudo SFn118]